MREISKKAFWLAITQIPVPVGLFWIWKVAAVRPSVAVAIAAGYELLVFLPRILDRFWAGFGAAVWGELKPETVKATADWIRNAIKGFGPGFRRRYKKQMQLDFEAFNVKGLGLINAYNLKLDNVFVDLRISQANPRQFNLDALTRKGIDGAHSLWDFLQRLQPKSNNGTALAIVGPPGCGKTTLMQFTALVFAANHQRRYKLRAATPLLLFLRDHVATICQDTPPTLAELAQMHFTNRQKYPSLNTPFAWFSREMGLGRCLILLDGLDEVAEPDLRRRISDWVDDQLRSYPRCRFVVTSRPQGYQDAPLERAHVLEVENFDAEQVRRFIENWYLANERVMSGNRLNESVRYSATQGAQDLLQRLRRTPTLHDLTANPLLLTMIAMVHRYSGALPGTRVELYAEICEVLLGRWRQNKGVADSLKATQKLSVLRPLAAHLMNELRKREIRTSVAVDVMAGPLSRIGVPRENAECFLREIQSSSGLLLERENGVWSFTHFTFQEHLTASHWREEHLDPDWNRLVPDSWWRETLRLYAAQSDATPIVRACLDAGTLSALTLAADCLEENETLDERVRAEATGRLIEALESEDDDTRHLAAEVHLNRRLDKLLAIDEQRAIDLRYVSSAEYQLFLDEMRVGGDYYQPDQWTKFVFNKSEALEPIRGIRYEDAVAFCAWLTQKRGGTVRYRLPRATEAGDHEAKPGTYEQPLATWCEGGVLVGLSQAGIAELNVKLATLSTLPRPGIEVQTPSMIGPERIEHPFATNVQLPAKPASDFRSALNLASGIQSGQITERAFQVARRPAAELARDLQRVKELFQDLGYVKNAEGIFPRKLAIHQILERASKHCLDIARMMDTPRAMALAFGIACERDSIRVVELAKELGQIRELAINRVEKLGDARDCARHLASNVFDSEYWTYLNIILSVLDVSHVTEWQALRTGQRKYMIRVFEDAYSGAHSANRHLILVAVIVWLSRKDPYSTLHLQQYLSGHWWMQIFVAREEGRLPAWEGIRIVRETASDKP